MKKAVATLAVLLIAVSILAGCSSNTPMIAKVGLGHITSVAKSTDLVVNEDGSKTPPVGQVDTVIAAVAFDKDGKILKVTIDTAQSTVDFDEDLQVKSDLAARGETKVELGPRYPLGKVSTIGKGWSEQIAEFEKWMIGKTVNEVKGLKVKERDATHKAVPDIPELISSVTITVEDYVRAVEEAYDNAFDVPKGAVTLGLGHEISVGKSRGYSLVADIQTLPSAQVETVMAAAAFDKDGKVVRAIIDTAQTKVDFDTDGKITTDLSVEPKTKVELGPAYGLTRVSTVNKDWFEQAAELEKWMAGKTVNQVTGLKVKQGNGTQSVPDVPELVSLVTISVHDYLAAVAEAFDNAK